MNYQKMRSGKYRSGLEKRIADALTISKVKFQYETKKFKYVKVSNHTYTPDFILPNGIIIEAKGRFTSQDRKKHLLVKEQHPTLDIRFVFSNSKAKLYKGAKTTYGDWCTKNGYKYADKTIPKGWLK
tara:strand:- start:451 stop:831 length:381 start_codon:yes stop_codon:yes gene_type:complete